MPDPVDPKTLSNEELVGTFCSKMFAAGQLDLLANMDDIEGKPNRDQTRDQARRAEAYANLFADEALRRMISSEEIRQNVKTVLGIALVFQDTIPELTGKQVRQIAETVDRAIKIALGVT